MAKAYVKKKGLSRTKSLGAGLSNDLGTNPNGNISVNGIGGGPGSMRSSANMSKSNLYSKDGSPKKVGFVVKKGTLKY